MGDAWEWIKAHPLWIVGGIGALVLIYVAANAGGGGSTVVAGASGPSDAEVNAAAQLQLAQAQGAQAGAQYTAQLQGQAQQIGGQIQLATISAQVANYQTEQQANVQSLGISAQRDVQLAGNQSQQLIALANDATQVQMQSLIESTNQARIAGVVAISNAPYMAQVATINALAPALPALALKAATTKNSYLQLPGGVNIGRNTPPSQWGALGGVVSGIGSAIAAII